jgi:hypothetical protein
MLIESGTEWTFNQSDEFKVVNCLSIPRPKRKDEHCWYFVPCINIKEDEDTYAFNIILVQHDAKLKWGTRWMGWCWFPSLNVYGMALVFFPLVLNHFSVEWKLFSKVCDPLIVGHKHLMKTDEPCWLNLVLNGPPTKHMSSKLLQDSYKERHANQRGFSLSVFQIVWDRLRVSLYTRLRF